ncbi:uncharacterized protein LOC125190272 isoform X2 [Salvia hispanica]|uniref:uncharacterized protein LOC125190272 isoform X2 n=1 Tax=Salvia hispanica TaxID=49212 RepID=UPI00200976A0|nr:uncharacterized protein LOC125190272 isoform X2 [Salvia hispanica]
MGNAIQPVSAALEEGKDELNLTNNPSAANLTNNPSGADGGSWTHGACSYEEENMSLPFNSLGYDQFSGHDIQEDCHSYNPNLNCTADPKVDKNWTDMSESCTKYEMLPPELSMRGDGADCLTTSAVTSMDCGELDMNLSPPMCETGAGYPIKNYGAEAQSSRISRFQMSGQFSSSSTSLLPLVENFGARGNKNDQGFLTLGTGGGREFRPNRNFSIREISNTLKEVSSQCNNPITGPHQKNLTTQLASADARILTHAGGFSRSNSTSYAPRFPSEDQEVSSRFNDSNVKNFPKNASSLARLSGGDAGIQTSAGELEGFAKDLLNIAHLEGEAATVQLQTNAGGLSRLTHSRMPTSIEDRIIGETGFRLNSNPFPSLHTLQTNTPTTAPSKSYTSVCQPSSIPLSSGSTLPSQPKCGSKPQIMSTHLACQPISWQQDHSRKNSINVPSIDSRHYNLDRDKLRSTSHVQPGNLNPAVEGTRTGAAKIGSFTSSVQPAGQFHAFHNISPIEAPRTYISPDIIRLQFSKGSSYQSDVAACFPERLGFQPDFATAQHTRGPYQHGMSTQSSAVSPEIDNSDGQVVPVTKLNITPQVAPIILPHPPLKRKAAANPIAPSGQRRKKIPQSAISDSLPQQRQNTPAITAPIHIPTAPLQVEWEGFEEPLEPTGHRCLLCKRDLSFTAEGLMYQPTAPPPVAVLPCGHTFHDCCLQLITPEDQLKIPPCIPCVVGDT